MPGRSILKSLTTAHAKAQGAQPGAYVLVQVDHKKADNPYKSRYPDNWEEKLNGSVFMKGYACVTTLIVHMIVSSAAVFAGTKHALDWCFYHDALIQLTNAETVAWMKDQTDAQGQTYYSRWITPEFGLNAGTVYAGRPPGNSPELMPLDCRLNKDIDDCVTNHVSWTHLLPHSDPKKFDRSTPKRQSSAYLRCFDPSLGVNAGCPTSTRIMHDVDSCISHLQLIYNNGGANVEGIGSRDGARRVDGKSTGKGRGGVTVKSAAPAADSFCHDDAKQAKLDSLAASKAKHAASATPRR